MLSAQKKSANIFACTLITAIFVSACSSSDNPDSDNLDAASSMRLVEQTVNRADGTVRVVSTRYDENGSITGETTRNNGEITFETSFEVNSLGQFTRRSEDTDQDGIENQSSNYFYRSGLGLSEIHRINSDNLIYRVDTFQFEGNLAIMRERWDITPVASAEQIDLANGSLRWRREFNYVDNRLSSVDIDSDGDGINDIVETVQYNPNGTLASTSQTSITEGTIHTGTNTYESGECNYNSGNSAFRYYCINGEQ